MVKASVVFDGQQLDVEGVYSRPYVSHLFDPGDDGVFELSKITWRGADVTELVFALSDIRTPLCEKIELAVLEEGFSLNDDQPEPDRGTDTDGHGF